MASRYLVTLGVLSDTVIACKFHSKPMYIVDGLKGWSLEGSHGIPRGLEIVSMSHKL